MRKIGELKGKPIVEGNPNEIKKNQIHYKESDDGITLSERKEDNTLSSVTSGSGGGENTGQIEYLYIKLNDLSYKNNQIDVGYKIVSVITYKYDTLVQREYKYHLNMFQAIARLGIDASMKVLAIKLIKINEDGCDATSLAAIVEKYPNYSVCEELTKEQYYDLLK